jgi:hydroxyethylthiazole kinase-like uncharacterized protein yjeF
MRVCTSRQMAAIDRDTIAAGTPGLELMERAGGALVDRLDAGGWLDDGGPVAIVCGKGNNGGDGLVMARLLAESGLPVRVLLLAKPVDLSADARANLDRLPAAVAVTAGDPARWADQVADLAAGCHVLVDAVFGTGIQPPLRPPYRELCRAINQVAAPVLAVDIPSGVSGEDGSADPDAVLADHTITIGLPKLGLLLPPGRDHVGQLTVVDIGFTAEVCRRHAPDWHLATLADYAAMLPPRPTDRHKYQVGSLLVVAGSRRYGGAAHLAALGALRSGVGMLTLGVPAGLETALRAALPEAILRVLPETASGTLAPVPRDALADLLGRQDALAVGPGLGDDPDTDRWVVDVANDHAGPLVLDADALSAFGRLGRTPAFQSPEVVLTPHPGELARMTGLAPADLARRRLALLPELADRWQAVVLLKGSPTLIGLPDGRLFVNPSGDDALARGGSGDVLTGLIGGLLAQGCAAADAALLAALVHGLAGEAAAARHGRRGVRTTEIADAVAGVLELLD